ncbi:Uncharacterised protein [Streptococcus pneumoniae]|nr:Uncharacterised protein [Streptococcus pneumoniae]VKL09015.1 Uncharacterised protein [Streptococcus pneumoniae]VMA98540.1 Uncharacterised protein [Streptococcus pneumoniae]
MKPKKYPYSGRRKKQETPSPIFSADRFLTFRESDWKFFIRDLVNEFKH